MADTRKDKRAPVSLKVRFKSATVDEFIEHYSRDVSIGGIFIKSSQPMPVGTLLKFQFQLKDESPLIKGVGRVVWSRASEAAEAEQPAGMGIKFIKMDPESRAMVERIVDAHDGDGGEFEEGRGSATSAEAPSDRPGAQKFFPDLPPAELPAPEDRTAVRQAAQFLAAAFSEGGTDQAALNEAEAKAEEARKRSEEIEAQRRAEAEARQRPRREMSQLPSIIVDPSLGTASEPAPAQSPRAAHGPAPEPALASSTRADATDAGRALLPSQPPGAFGKGAESIAPPPDARSKSPLVPAIVLALVVAVAAFVAMRGAPDEALPEPVGLAPADDASVEVAALPPPTIAPPPETAQAVAEEDAAPVEDGSVAEDAGALAEGVDEAPADAGVASADLSGDAAAAAELLSVQVRTSPRSSDVSVNGVPQEGHEPIVMLPLGVPVTVAVKSAGRSPMEREVVADPSLKVLKFALESLPHVVRVTTTPSGARVAAGSKRGNSPVTLDLGDSVHGPLLVQARLSGYSLGRVLLQPSAFHEVDGAMVADVEIALVLRPVVKPAPAATPAEGDAGAPETGIPTGAPSVLEAPAETTPPEAPSPPAANHAPSEPAPAP